VRREGVTANADVGAVRAVLDILLHLGGVGGRDEEGAAGRTGRTAGIGEQLVRQSRRQCQIVRADAIVERLRAGAVDVRGLVPAKPDIEFAGLRSVEFILLIAVADVFGPGIELIHAVFGAGGGPASDERPRRDRAVLVIFG